MADMFGRRHCLVVGRATTAIYLALRALRPSGGGKVVLPAVVCPSPANAAVYAGMEPIFCDVDLADANMDVASCRSVLEQEEDVAAILPVHLYGHVANLGPILDLATEFNVAVIEDFAQALGGTYRERRLGGWGDVSIVSFGHTKIVDVGRGGALLTDRDDIAEAVAREQGLLPRFSQRVNEMAAEHHKLYYALKPFREHNHKLEKLLLPIPAIYKDMYLYGNNGLPVGELNSELDDLSANIEARRDRAAMYRELLSHPSIVHFSPREGSVPWRYSFRIKGPGREPILDLLRQKGVDVSAWYPPINRWYTSGIEQKSMESPTNSVTIGEEVVNLWVNPEIEPEKIRETCGWLTSLIDQAERAAVRY